MPKEKSVNKFLKSPFGRGEGVGHQQYYLFADFSHSLNSITIHDNTMLYKPTPNPSREGI